MKYIKNNLLEKYHISDEDIHSQIEILDVEEFDNVQQQKHKFN